MVALIVLFDAFKELLQSLRAVAETIDKNNRDLPDAFVDIGIGRSV
jgi:hypothetical protein